MQPTSEPSPSNEPERTGGWPSGTWPQRVAAALQACLAQNSGDATHPDAAELADLYARLLLQPTRYGEAVTMTAAQIDLVSRWAGA